MADTSKSERWSFWIDDAVRALRVAGFTLAHAPDHLVDRRAVMVGERGGQVLTCALRNELTGLPSTEVRCRADGVPVELTLRPELAGDRAIDPEARATARQRTRAVLTATTLAGVGFLAAVIAHYP